MGCEMTRASKLGIGASSEPAAGKPTISEASCDCAGQCSGGREAVRLSISTLALGLALAFVPNAARAEVDRSELVALLPLAGAARQTRALDAALGRIVAARGLKQVIGPNEVQARLGLRPPIQRTLTLAQDQITLSRRRELEMNREGSLAAAERALATLRSVEGELYRRDLALQAQLARAQAALLDPADPNLARGALRAVLQLDPGFHATMANLPPRTARLLAEVQGERLGLPAPTPVQLARIASELGVRQVLWCALRPAHGAASVRATVLLYDRRGGQLLQLSRDFPAPHGGKDGASSAPSTPDRADDALLGAVANLVENTLQHQRASVSTLLAARGHSEQQQSSQAATGRSWYRRWWVWGLAVGALGAGAAISAYALGSRTTPAPIIEGPFELLVRFR